jgi:hypothetical protein
MRVDDLDKSPQREEHMSPCYVCIGMELLRSTIRAHGSRWAGPSPGVRVCEASTPCGLVPVERGLT